ncbi:MAG: DUF1934 domain-containing protein [Clostridia bacterium]|nr:DUF1934 domain-containing protein [Clostridia bacterium]
MKKEITIKILSKQYELSKVLMDKLFASMEEEEFLDEAEGEETEEKQEDDVLELYADGFLTEENGCVEITYEESELTGMEGAKTKISFEKNNSGLVSMMRGGSVTTAMVFEEGRRHICVYETPIMPFELCIHTLKVKNHLLENGTLYLDYIVEFKGAQAERTKFTFTIDEKTPSAPPFDEYDHM